MAAHSPAGKGSTHSEDTRPSANARAHGELGCQERADAHPARPPVALLGPRGGLLHGRATV